MKNLNHITKKTSSWIEVFALDTWAEINSESEAMLQALHSRSTGWIRSHLEVLKKTGSENFMSKFYVGYWHKSIGDCGSITLFIEGLSMLGAKAIQDTKLYNGQEASTRYIDFSQQAILNPIGSKEGEELLEKQRAFYLEILPEIKEHMKTLFPKQEWQSEKLYESTISAKAFDVGRGFLPAGCSTNIAWHTTLRQVADRITVLRHHPLQEMREVAETLLDVVLEKYPNSFTKKTYEDTESYNKSALKNYYYHNAESSNMKLSHNGLDAHMLQTSIDELKNRPNSKTELPTFLDSIGNLSFEYTLDFGSFRDIQRHRAPFQRMPLLTTEIWFHEWYLNILPETLKNKAETHLQEIEKILSHFDASPEIQQYYTPMGYKMSCHIMGTLPALTYLCELRSTTYVHPTLRLVAIEMGELIEQEIWIPLFLDKNPELLDLRRGKQDIKLKDDE